jgi:hypothetical protein
MDTAGLFLWGLKRPGRETDHLPPSSAEVKNTWIYTTTPHTSSWHSVGTTLPFTILDSKNEYTATVMYLPEAPLRVLTIQS